MEYSKGLPSIDLWIKKGTSDVPADGRYHLISHGVLVGSFRSQKAAFDRYREMAEAQGVPLTAKPKLSMEDIRHEDVERDLDRTSAYWASSSNFSGRGGKYKR